MIVIKLGGSLLGSERLQQWLEIIYLHGQGRCVVVSGGGIFADFIRRTQFEKGFDDHVAHPMAMCSMEQFAYYCQSLQPQLVLARSLSEIKQLLSNQAVPVCLPSSVFQGSKLLKPDWTVTSDSIAACLANQLDAQILVLVKSIESTADSMAPAKLAETGVVDKAFPDYCRPEQYTFHCLAADQTDKFLALLL